jgi:hypothetical protein
MHTHTHIPGEIGKLLEYIANLPKSLKVGKTREFAFQTTDIVVL